MKLATFRPEPASEVLAGVVNGDSIHAFARGAHAVRDVLAGVLTADADIGRYALADVELLAPIPHPGTIFAIGLNYADHIAEMGNSMPEWPTVFVKVNTCVAAPGGPIVCPEVVRRLDYEGELMIAIGRDGRPGGYCVANDVSARDLQKREPQWVRAKGSDTFCPFGPWLTTADEVPDPQNLGIRTWVNGELRQNSNTSNLVFGIDELIGVPVADMHAAPGRPDPDRYAGRRGPGDGPAALPAVSGRDQDRDRRPRRDRAPSGLALQARHAGGRRTRTSVLVFFLVLFELELVEGFGIVELRFGLQLLVVRLEVVVVVFFVEVAHVAQSNGSGNRILVPDHGTSACRGPCRSGRTRRPPGP